MQCDGLLERAQATNICRTLCWKTDVCGCRRWLIMVSYVDAGVIITFLIVAGEEHKGMGSRKVRAEAGC